MEDEPVVPEPAARRSKRARAPVRTADFTRTDKIEDELEEEREESSDEFQESRRKIKRNKATEGASTSAAARKANLSFIEVIKGDGKDIPDVVKRWVEQYERNQKSAMSGLLSMLFEACGAKYRLHEEDIDETDVDDVVVALVNMARRGEVEDYQSSKRDFKNFKDNLVYFWDNLVSECQNGPLFDQSLFDKCLDYIIALSCTPPRSYRQIASLMGLQLVTSFINVAKLLGSQRETTQRQLNAEKKKKIEGPRVESLTKRLLFVHRYRDIDPDIRVSCIESLVWVLSYPSLFLQDLYLKYLGWTLNDKSAGVRKASILALQNLYEADDNVPSLNLFTERFYPRMLELADDIDISVSVCAIGLVKQLLRHQLVPDEELGSLYDLLIDDPPDVRRAIGALVYDHLIAQKFNDSQSRSTGSDNDSSEVHISRMLQILKEFSADPILSSYVIDDVWDYMAAMKDWKCIIRMLLEDNPSAELDDADATNLIRLLFASVRKAVGERIVLQLIIETHITPKVKSCHDETYPQLLRKFISDKGKVAPLVETIVYMNLELYSLKRQEQNGGDEYSLLVNLKRSYEFQLSDKVPLESLYQDLVLKQFQAALSSLVEKRDALLEQLEYFLHNPLKLNSDGRCKNQLAYRVCGILADIWCLFRKTKFASTKLEILGYCPDESTVDKYWKMCEQLLNVSDDAEDEEENREYVEETNADAVMFALAKLVATDTVLKGNIKTIQNWIILPQRSYLSRGEVWPTKVSGSKFPGNDESLSSKSFQECKDLAVRLSGSYVGVARNKYKAEILSIVREGINYAFSHAPKQLSFLDNVVLHFVSKLPATDILDIMRGVERRTENVKTDEDPSGWRAYYTFLDTLREKYLKNEGVKDGKEGTSVRRRGRPRKKQNLQGKRLFDEQSSSEEEDSISGSDQDAGVEEKQEDDEEDAPLIHSLRASSKLRSIRVSKEENRDQARTVLPVSNHSTKLKGKELGGHVNAPRCKEVMKRLSRTRITMLVVPPAFRSSPSGAWLPIGTLGARNGDALPDPESPGTWSGSGRTQTHLLEAEIRTWSGSGREWYGSQSSSPRRRTPSYLLGLCRGPHY
ncbi:Sister-chromatid cohesion protein 3 [Sesamum angolense]|uniref:Cohesin subunit SA-3 n=1 Tax=Sesamum angolense TaxID=2727404 RepID=A0AAE1X8P0_9LAMI|nr:Sister-chromatid cohesion protein 3 [Sesamum angolense]